ncbi:MAG: GntR family transcriptional regulator [Clostridia bacterium]|nr:GntR family transcriptional regulator [Clostridia bacterium]
MKNDDLYSAYQLNKYTPLPLYYQIASIIREQILSGKFAPGDQILTEEKLQKMFGVSRATVRRAISDLVYDGLLERNHSRGTIVTQPKLEENLFTVGSFTSTMLQSGKNLSTRILEFNRIFGDASLNSKFALETGSSFYYFRRLRLIDGSPVCIEDCYAPVKYFENLSSGMFKDTGMEQSTYNLLQKQYGITIKSIRDIMGAVALNAEDARLLSSHNGAPVLLRQRMSYDQVNRPVLYTTGRYIIKLTMNLP